MGVAVISKVVTSSDTIGRAINIQLGNRNQVIVIEGINASGQSIPPFIILLGKLYQANQYRDLPTDQVIAISNNGWTTNKLSFKWLKYFNKYTASYISRAYRLLILDGHGSYTTPKFNQYCIENKIITLYMPAYILHLLQPLNVGCFSSLKVVYGRKIRELAR